MNFNIWTDGWIPKSDFKIHIEALQKLQYPPLQGIVYLEEDTLPFFAVSKARHRPRWTCDHFLA